MSTNYKALSQKIHVQQQLFFHRNHVKTQLVLIFSQSDSKNLPDIFHRGASASLPLTGCETIEEAKEKLEGGADINEKDEESGK